MIWTNQMLEDILVESKLGFSIIEISLRLNLPTDQLLDDFYNPDSQVKKYYMEGKTQGKADLRSALHQTATNGSISASTEYKKLLNESEISDKILELYGN